MRVPAQLNWRHVLRHAWNHRGPLARVLWPLGVLSWIWVTLKQRQIRREPLPPAKLPVVIVGNVIVGGAGKTPTTIALAQDLKARGEFPLIISKGHGRQPTDEIHFLVTPHTSAAKAGDEPLLMAQQCSSPVVVTRSRQAAIGWAVNKFPQTTVVLFDDGLQDDSLNATAEVLVFDARGVGNGWLLPAGPLREPWPRQTWRDPCVSLHLLSVTAHEEVPPLGDLDGPLWLCTRQLKPTANRLDGTVSTPLSKLERHPVQALAAIAKPEQFFTMLKSHGFSVQKEHHLRDHQGLDLAFKRLDDELPVLVTAKDAVKLRDWPEEWQRRTWIIDLDFVLPAGLCESVAQALHPKRM